MYRFNSFPIPKIKTTAEENETKTNTLKIDKSMIVYHVCPFWRCRVYEPKGSADDNHFGTHIGAMDNRLDCRLPRLPSSNTLIHFFHFEHAQQLQPNIRTYTHTHTLPHSLARLTHFSTIARIIIIEL